MLQVMTFEEKITYSKRKESGEVSSTELLCNLFYSIYNLMMVINITTEIPNYLNGMLSYD